MGRRRWSKAVRNALVAALGLGAGIYLTAFARGDSAVRVRLMSALEMDVAARAGDYAACYYQANANCQTPIDPDDPRSQPNNWCSTVNDLDKGGPTCSVAAGGCTNCSADGAISSCIAPGALYQSCQENSDPDGCGKQQTNQTCVWYPISKFCGCGSDWKPNAADCESTEVIADGSVPCPE